MLDWIFHSVAAQLSIAAIIVIACLAGAWFLPPFRRWFIGAASLVIAAGAIYAKGARDQAKSDKAKRDKAVKKAEEDYAKIDARPDDAGTVDKRLRDGSF
jgi:hypothetical protein